VGNPIKQSAETLSKLAARSSSYKGIEIIIVRSILQNIIQMSLFEQVKMAIDDLKFKDGSKDLPRVRREMGRDRRIND